MLGVEKASLRASPAPADAVLPQASRGGLLGVVMLETRFPRPPGDAGHPATFGRPVRHRVVPGAFPRSVVTSAAALRGSGLDALFVSAVRALAHEGAQAITTSCGFLVLLQAELQAAVRMPVVTSSLLQLPALLEREAQVGVLTISAEHLGDEHLLAAGVPPARLRDVIVQGTDPAGAFAAPILGDAAAIDFAAAEADLVAAARSLQVRAPQLRTVVLECTNMPPHARALARATGWQLKSLLTAPGLVVADAELTESRQD
jgi:hypothetical protein